ncbi:MAG: hypothetical protein EYC70_01720 [Planctomycetota bacterium]|nr:MAG: hypothetical protein EYC70_01720 [Planctomycetota bacterium]
MRRAGALLALLPACAAPPREPASGPVLLYAQDFAEPQALESFEFTDRAAWRWSDAGGLPSLELHAQSRYQPPYRSPLSVALLPCPPLAEYVLEVEALQTGPEYGHRDLILVFGWSSPSRFCYAHLGAQPDANSHNLFVVADAPRRAVTPVGTRTLAWGQEQWHRLRLQCLRGSEIRVWFDGELLFQAAGMPAAGRIGLGSFDDTGRFRAIRVWSVPQSETKPDARASSAAGSARPEISATR